MSGVKTTWYSARCGLHPEEGDIKLINHKTLGSYTRPEVTANVNVIYFPTRITESPTSWIRLANTSNRLILTVFDWQTDSQSTGLAIPNVGA